MYTDNFKAIYILPINHTHLLLTIQSDRRVTTMCLLLFTVLHLKPKGGTMIQNSMLSYTSNLKGEFGVSFLVREIG